MRRVASVAIAWVLCAASPAAARWEVGVVASDRLSTGSPNVLDSWDQPLGVFVGLVRPLGSGVELAPRLAARIGWYDEFRGPPSGLVGILDRPRCVGSCGTEYEAEGLRSVDGTVGIRATFGSSAKRFLGVSGGILVTDVGKITRTTWVRSGSDAPVQVTSETVEGTDTISARALLGLHGGIIFRSPGSAAGMGLEASVMVATDRSVSWMQLAYFAEFR